jgi:glycosyltransferase involved in cell wall biosynthesis
MRVVYVCSLASGGPLKHLLDLAPHVAHTGVEVTVLCASEEIAAEFRRRGVTSTSVPLGHKLDLGGAAAVWPRLSRADVVHTHDRRTGLLARPQARLRGAVSVHTLHGVPDEIFGLVGRDDGRLAADVSEARVRWLLHGLLPIEAGLARLGTTVVPSAALRRFLVEHGFPAERTHVMPNGVEVRRSEPGPRHEPLRIATAGILEYRKGVDVLLDACARVDLPLRVDVFGDGSLRSELERRARRLGVAATFHGRVADVGDRLPEVDVFALPTRGDNLPIAVLEAMAFALPVVATRTGGLPELVEDGKTGFLVEPDDPDGLAAAIARLGEDDEARLRLGRAGAARVAERFEAGDVARRMVVLYRQLLSRR